jgi:tRNA threonylcarbamoyladenosine biosynthesis protein TsaB
MRVLALDTTTRAGSTALIEDDRVVDERDGDGTRTHASRLPAEITELLRHRHWAVADIDLFAVAAGPGSFTGLRIGIATVQGLAAVHGRRIVAVPALDALAQIGSRGLPAGQRVAAWMDAHRRDVFAALYRVSGPAPFQRDRLIEIEGATVGTPAATLARWRAQTPQFSAAFIGDGAALYEAEILGEPPAGVLLPRPALAGAVGLLAAHGAFEALAPSAVRPLYVRRPDVELVRDGLTAAAREFPREA